MSVEDYKRAKEILKAYTFCLDFMPGIFSIFYGDEVGVQGLGNLENRKTYPWGRSDRELLEYFRYLGEIRNNEEFLKKAGLNIVDLNNDYFMFEREGKDGAALIAVNRTNDDKKILVPEKYETPSKIYTLNNSNRKVLHPYGGVSLIKK